MKTVLFFVVVLVIPVLTATWAHSSSGEDRTWRHSHNKRHLPMTRDTELKKRSQPPRYKAKPAGSLIPALREDDIDNDEIVSVAIGPPVLAPRYDKIRKKLSKQDASPSNTVQFLAADTQHNLHYPKITSSIVVDVLSQLGKEFLSRQVSEDFIFGQYVGNAMRNLTLENKLQLQHHILELIVQYQKMNHFPIKPAQETAQESDKMIIKIKPLNSTKVTTDQPEVTSRSYDKIESYIWDYIKNDKGILPRILIKNIDKP